MSVHFNKECMRVDDVICNVPTKTHWNKIQPHLVLRGKANEVKVEIINGRKTAIIN